MKFKVGDLVKVVGVGDVSRLNPQFVRSKVMKYSLGKVFEVVKVDWVGIHLNTSIDPEIKADYPFSEDYLELFKERESITMKSIKEYKELAEEEMAVNIRNILYKLQKNTGISTWNINVELVEFQVLDQESPTTVVSSVKISTCI